MGTQQIDGGDGTHRVRRCDRRQTFAERAIADLIVILNEGDESGRRQQRTRLTARMAAELHHLPLKCEAFGQRPPEHIGVAEVFGVVALILAGCRHVQHMMYVVVPLRRKVPRQAGVVAEQAAGLVFLILQHQMHRAAAGAHAFCEFVEHVPHAVVDDGMDGIEAQSIEIVFLDPILRVVNDELTHRTAVSAVVVDGRTPRRLMPIGKERRCVRGQVISVRPKVVVHDVQQHHESARVCGIHQRLQILGPAIARVGRVQEHTIVAPVPRTRKIRDRHDLDGRHPEGRQMIETLDGTAKRPGGGKRTDVQFVHHGLVPRPAVPFLILPAIRRRIDDFAGPMDVVRLKSGRRVGHAQAVGKNELVARAGTCAVHRELVPPLAQRRHGPYLAGQRETHSIASGRP